MILCRSVHRLAHQVAQKLHACTAPNAESWVNDRAQLAMHVYTGSLAEIRDVAMRLFAARRLHAWPQVVTARQGRDTRYAAARRRLDVDADREAAVKWVNDYLANIDAAEP